MTSTKERIRCLECGMQCRLLNPPHLRKHGLTIAEYLAKYPGAPLSSAGFRERVRQSFNQSVRRYTESVNSEEIEQFRQHPRQEERRGIVDHVVCRECGALLRGRIHGHLRRRHAMTAENYRRKWTAPVSSLRHRQKVKCWSHEERTKNPAKYRQYSKNWWAALSSK